MTIFKAAAVAMAVAAYAPAAQAATYVQYEVYGAGRVFTFNVVTDPPWQISQFEKSQLYSAIPLTGYFNTNDVSISANSLWFRGRGTTRDPNAYANYYDIQICGSGTAQFAAADFTIDPGCASSLSYTTGGSGEGLSLSGPVTGLTVRKITSDTSVAGGLRSVVFSVPEPSTWALMLAGFGMAGYALRRRKVRVAFA